GGQAGGAATGRQAGGAGTGPTREGGAGGGAAAGPTREREAGGAATGLTRERWLLPLFAELGYGRLQAARAIEIEGKSYPVSHAWGSVPIHLVGAGVDLDRRSPGVAGAAAMAPHAMVQELLNRSEDHLWAFVSNGLRLRVLRDNASLTGVAYLELDLEAIMSGEAYADFALLWLVCHQSRVEAERPEACFLERWREEAWTQGARALDRLRVGVEAAIVALGEGFLAHPANRELRAALVGGGLDRQDFYRELLRLVYRLLFLFVAEDRDLLAVPGAGEEQRGRYLAYYSLDRLRTLAERRSGDAHADLWQGLRLVMDGLAAGGIPALGLPALGGFLWSGAASPHLMAAGLANRDLLRAVRHLASTTEGRALARVDYRNLGAEELGAVYESLLELSPELSAEQGWFRLASVGHERKSTGSYYTPTSLVDQLLSTALDPVLDEAARAPDPEAAILGLRVLDPACGSGHFLVAAGRRMAHRLARARCEEEEPDVASQHHALRDVIGHCLYGIDRNEMAIELTKVSLWMEALDPGRPLSFLDHHLACGDALLGATPELLAGGVPDDAFKALTGDDRSVVSALRRRNQAERRGQGTLDLGLDPGAALEHLAAEALAIEAMPDDDPPAVAAKARRWEELQRGEEAVRAEMAADAWCAAFVARKATGAPVVTQAVVERAASLGAAGLEAPVAEEVRRLAQQYRFLHWHLAFPEVLGPGAPAASGGFDVVLGNPPWGQAQLEEKEFFATRVPDVAGAPGARRKAMIAALEVEDPALYLEYRDALRRAEGESHLLRASGRFPLCGRGRINTYAVFAETMRDAVAPAGRAGVVVPTGIATDDTTKAFFADLVERAGLVSLYDFENREGLFPAVDSRMKFCLLTLSGRDRPAAEGAEFAFFCHQVAALSDPGRRFTLSAEDLALLNPNTRTCPVFRSRRDAELTKAVYCRVPVLLSKGPPARNPWGVSFRQGLFNMTSDSHLFRTREELEAQGWALEGNTFVRGGEAMLALYEAKMAHHFDHRWASYTGSAIEDLDAGAKSDPWAVALPRYWVAEPEVTARLPDAPSWLLGYRRICRSTDERSVIPIIIPRRAAGDSIFFVRSAAIPPACAVLGACLNSFAVDFLARQKVGGTNLNFFIAEQLPVLPPETYDQPTPWDPGQRLDDW
ncbi:MAG: Eco57I restriction-modification methylase domain-containing protein, partial [Acidimicrobiales bacterium]